MAHGKDCVGVVTPYAGMGVSGSTVPPMPTVIIDLFPATPRSSSLIGSVGFGLAAKVGQVRLLALWLCRVQVRIGLLVWAPGAHTGAHSCSGAFVGEEWGVCARSGHVEAWRSGEFWSWKKMVLGGGPKILVPRTNLFFPWNFGPHVEVWVPHKKYTNKTAKCNYIRKNKKFIKLQVDYL